MANISMTGLLGIVSPTVASAVRYDIDEYERLCAKHGATPSDEAIRAELVFLLAMSGQAGTTVAEGHGHGGDDFFFADQLGGGHGGGHSSGGHDSKTPKLVTYVQYLFRKPKVAALFKEEMREEFSKLDMWEKLISMKKKLAELRGDDSPGSVDHPTMTK